MSVWRKSVHDCVHVEPLVVGHQSKPEPRGAGPQGVLLPFSPTSHLCLVQARRTRDEPHEAAFELHPRIVAFPLCCRRFWRRFRRLDGRLGRRWWRGGLIWRLGIQQAGRTWHPGQRDVDVCKVPAWQVSVTLRAKPTCFDEVGHDGIGLIDAQPALSEGHGSGQI